MDSCNDRAIALTYRPDIDGLRAIAVLAVVIFHLGVPGFDGGYVGVDVFFVISGFLITGIILGKHERGEFSFSAFYGRRIRRLIPPLVVTVACTVIGAAFLFTAYDMVLFARSAVAALFSVSNIVFFAESGYWDEASELKPLLHTWSLAVEEQFYLFWPALLAGLFALRRRLSLVAAMGTITVAGFGLSVWYTRVDQAAAFYLLPFRVFQFSAGALAIWGAAWLANQESPRLANLALYCGLVLIGISVYALGDGSQFPGWVVSVPTAGAALCLMAGAQAGPTNPATTALTSPLALWLGRVSYSMYLVHWPLIALYRYQYGMALGALEQLGLAVAILIATVLLHYGVERRVYSRAGYSGTPGSTRSKHAVPAIILSVGTIAGITSTAWLGDGWQWRRPTTVLSPGEVVAGQQLRLRDYLAGCRLDNLQQNRQCENADSPLVLVLGNSHEPDGYNFIHAVQPDNALTLISFGNLNPCGDIGRDGQRFTSDDASCQHRLDTLFSDEVTARLRTVVYSSNQPFAHNKATTLQLLEALKASNPSVRIVTLGGYINTERRCSFYLSRTGSTDSCAQPDNVTYFADYPQDRRLYREIMGVTDLFIDKVELLCRGRQVQTCATQTPDGTPAFYDRHHLSLPFARYAGELYVAQHPKLLTLLQTPAVRNSDAIQP